MSSIAARLCPLLHVQEHSVGLRLGRDRVSDSSHQARSSSGPTAVSLSLWGAQSHRDTTCWLRPHPAWGVRDLTEGKLGVCMATLAPEAPVMQVWATRSFPVVPFATAFQV